MRRICQIVSISIFATGIAFLSGCGVTLSPVKKTPVRIVPLELSIAPNFQNIQVQFEDTLPEVPLADTVWDNEIGPFDDQQDSDRIGFVQDEKSLAAAESAGGPGAALAVGTSPSYTRIYIPFGRIFEGVFQTGLSRVYPNSQVLDDSSLSNESPNTVKYIVKLKVVDFKVWEQPLNHLNFTAKIECEVYQPNNVKTQVDVYEAHDELLRQPLGSVFSTDMGMARNMNTMANQFAAALSQDILEHLAKFSTQSAGSTGGAPGNRN